MSACASCGRPAPATEGDDAIAVPLGWMLDRAGGRVQLICPECARANVRAIEAKLDREWW